MKTRIGIFCAVLLASVLIQAQDVAFGLKGGLNLANLNVKDPEGSYNSRTGYHAGVFLRGKFSKIAVQPELLLFTQGTEVKHTTLGDFKDNFTYLSVPVMLKYYPVMGLNLQVGPQFGFLLDGERKYESIIGDGSTDIKDYYNSSDVSISVGGGWDFKFGLSLDCRYNVGVKDLNNVSNGEEAKSKVFLISLGWNFLK
jgi:Outer membrane protein beta-barrel domain